MGAGMLAADKLERANINPATGLATDYLNHFNEVVMLLEMLPAMPECAEDVLDWEPADYESHFENSTFSEKQLAVQAYRAAPVRLRCHLERLVEQINDAVLSAQEAIRAAPDPAVVSVQVAETATHRIKPLIAMASGVIHGHVDAKALAHEGDEAQAEIDALFA
ncbi:hypothetical protein [Polymorphum gilvum]|uniref:Uncharacterized protein n=1 Tax=Polymorphum gilvum (strain LMG 25793 / CGMCC 1.9160 / SL003B-26A1) TaxID=991905 RepID=F2IYD1_POLGS|nr:hypothetical protein [Polymorphum gilvum]ADZ71743.1 hypothetical protein SL003B_3321 [Polymorphum gilvum SL003B-26A1]